MHFAEKNLHGGGKGRGVFNPERHVGILKIRGF